MRLLFFLFNGGIGCNPNVLMLIIVLINCSEYYKSMPKIIFTFEIDSYIF